MNGIADIASELTSRVGALTTGQADSTATLKARAREFVGLTFFAPLLKQASESVLKGKYGHGGRGEQIFRGQLNELLAMRIGRSGRLGLAESIAKRLSLVTPPPEGSEVDVKA